MHDRDAATPSRSVAFELVLGGGLFVVVLVLLAIASIPALGAASIPYFLLCFAVGLVAWIPLLLLFRRLTAGRGVGVRILGSLAAALLAIGVNAAAVALVIAGLVGSWGLAYTFAAVASIVFLISTLVAALVNHLIPPGGRG